MGFVGEVLGTVKGIHIFYVIGILLFVAAFIVVLFKTFKIPKPELQAFKNDILDPEDQDPRID